MDLVFNFATRISVLVAGRLLDRGRRRRRSPPTSGCARSISARTRMAELLARRGPQRRLWRGARHPRSQLRLEDGQSLALLGRNGVGKTTLINSLIGVTTRHGGRIALAGADITALPPHLRARARRRLDAAGAQHLPLADRRGEPHRRRDAGPMDVAARLRDVSAAAGAAPQHGPAIVGRRAADAGDRPRAGAQSAPAAARRADRRPRADHRRRIARRVARTRARRACR